MKYFNYLIVMACQGKKIVQVRKIEKRTKINRCKLIIIEEIIRLVKYLGRRLVVKRIRREYSRVRPEKVSLGMEVIELRPR